jgi:hypothetical protein
MEKFRYQQQLFAPDSGSNPLAGGGEAGMPNQNELITKIRALPDAVVKAGLYLCDHYPGLQVSDLQQIDRRAGSLQHTVTLLHQNGYQWLVDAVTYGYVQGSEYSPPTGIYNPEEVIQLLTEKLQPGTVSLSGASRRNRGSTAFGGGRENRFPPFVGQVGYVEPQTRPEDSVRNTGQERSDSEATDSESNGIFTKFINRVRRVLKRE